VSLKDTIKTLAVAVTLGTATIGISLGLMAARQAPETPKTDEKKAAAPMHTCLYGGNYDSRIIDRETIILTDRRNNSVQVKVKGCTLNDFDPLMIVFRGTTQICNPIDLDLSTVSMPGNFTSKCFVESVTPLPRKG
jgi:hypothetical protein